MSDPIHDDDERDLQELFHAARQAESASAPAFSRLTRARRPTLRRLVLLGASTGTLACAAALTVVWMAPPEVALNIQPVLVARQTAAELPTQDPLDPALLEVPMGSVPGGDVPAMPPPAAAKEAPLDSETVRRLAALGYLSPNEEEVRPNESIADLPIAGRLHQEVLTLAPGAKDKSDSNARVHGSRERDFKSSVSGGVAQGVAGVVPASTVNANSIQDIPPCVRKMFPLRML